jgi:hypothetical protein
MRKRSKYLILAGYRQGSADQGEVQEFNPTSELNRAAKRYRLERCVRCCTFRYLASNFLTSLSV